MNDVLDVCTHTRGGATVVRASGEVDLATVGRLEQQLRSACAQSPPTVPVVVELSEVSFLDAAGLSALVRAQQICRSQGRALWLVAPYEAVLRPIRLTRLDEVLNIVSSVDGVLGAGDEQPGG